jgi:hypothetical protein
VFWLQIREVRFEVRSLKIEGERQGLEDVMEVPEMEEQRPSNPTKKRKKMQLSFLTPNPFTPLSNKDCDENSSALDTKKAFDKM